MPLPPREFVRPFGDLGYPGESGGSGGPGESGQPGMPGRPGEYRNCPVFQITFSMLKAVVYKRLIYFFTIKAKV